jgi:hypothetical protein
MERLGGGNMKCTVNDADSTLRVPVSATYRVIDGVATMTGAEYADVSADVVARLLLRGFGLPICDFAEPNKILIERVEDNELQKTENAYTCSTINR